MCLSFSITEKQQSFRLLFLLKRLATINVIVSLLLSVSFLLNISKANAQSLNGEETVEANSLSSASPDESTEFNTADPFAWMARFASQASSLNYEISFVLSSPSSETQPYLWRHANLDGNNTVEQLSLLNGPGFEHIRYNQVISIFEPGFPPFSIPGAAIDGPIPSILLSDPDFLKEAYEFILVGRSRVSGRAAQQLRIVPRDKTRYGYHLWLDEDSGMLLKLNMYDLNGKLIEQVQVTQLTISDRVKQVFESLKLSSLPRVITMKNPPQRNHEWQVNYLPLGMKPVKQDTHRLAITGQIVEYSMLSDGLVDVSIYIQQASQAFAEGLEYKLNTQSVLSRTNGRVQVTVVGEIPMVTAARIAESIALVERPDTN